MGSRRRMDATNSLVECYGTATSALYPKTDWCGLHDEARSGSILLKVENRKTPKISQMLIFGQVRRWDAA
jgi:phage terminase large subunit-like protein